MESYRASVGFNFRECSDRACLDAAESKCEPVHQFEGYFTVEGAPAFRDVFLVPDDGQCRVVSFHDHSRNYWGACRIQRLTCPTLITSRSDYTLGCKAEVVWKAKSCPNPMR